jgi:hypothetical protein
MLKRTSPELSRGGREGWKLFYSDGERYIHDIHGAQLTGFANGSARERERCCACTFGYEVPDAHFIG